MRRVRAFAAMIAVALFGTALPVHAAPRVVYRQSAAVCGHRVALTFDDGPHPKYTPQILDILAEYGVKATFFVVGENASYHPELVERAAREGHEIGNHTYDHTHAGKLSAEAFRRDVRACSDTVERITGVRPTLFRPPEGVCTDVARRICEEDGYTIVMWCVDTRDWAHTPPADIVRNVEKNTADGAVILMHDFIGKNSPTPAALRQIIPLLLGSGYEFVTISQLFP